MSKKTNYQPFKDENDPEEKPNQPEKHLTEAVDDDAIPPIFDLCKKHLVYFIF